MTASQWHNRDNVAPSVQLSRSKRFVIFSVLLVACVLLAFTLAEIYVRWYSPWGHVTPELLATQRPLYSPSVFARYIFPSVEHDVRNKDGKFLYSINALGYRGPLFAAHKPDNVVRIIVYGGSSVFDHDNPGDRDWPHRVQQRLQKSGYPNVEVINAGIPGHATYDAVGRLYAEGHLFDPDYVLLYDQWNEIKDFRSTEPLLHSRRPPSSSDIGDPLFTYQNRVDRWLCEISQLYVRLRERYYTGGFRISSEGALPEGDYVSTLSETALRQYGMDVRAFVDVARNAGAVPVLVTEGRLIAQDNTAVEKKRVQYSMVLLTHEALLHAFEETDRILNEVSRQKQVELIDASSALSGRDDLFLDTVHLTDRGSSELAETVATSMTKLLSKRGDAPPNRSRRNVGESANTFPSSQ